MDKDKFRRALDGARNSRQPLDALFVRGFNKFIASDPFVLEWEYFGDGTTLLNALYDYLVYAIFRKYPVATWRALVVKTPHVLAETNPYGFALLHDACRFNPDSLNAISFLVDQFPHAARMKTELQLDTPLHFACRNKAPVAVIRALVKAHPRAVDSRDRAGDTPLHDACRFGVSFDAIQYLVMQQPQTCLLRNKRGDLPLSLAVSSGRRNHDKPIEFMKRITKADVWGRGVSFDAMQYFNLVKQEPHFCLHRRLLPMDKIKDRMNRDRDVVEFLRMVTKVAANVLVDRLLFTTRQPRKLFERVAAFARGGPVDVSMVELVLRGCEIAVLFQRNDVQEDFYAQIANEY